MRTGLDAAEDASPVQAVEAVTQALLLSLEATAATFLILDLSGRALVRLTHVPLAARPASPGTSRRTGRRAGRESATVLPFDGGPGEQTMRSQQVRVLAADPASGAGWTVLAPVTERGEAIGLLELTLPTEPDARAITEIEQTAHLLAFVVIANRRHTDLFEWGRRTRAFTLAAEIQQRLLPGAFTCEGGSFTLAAWLEPASAVAGDVFDYSVDRDALHVCVTDAMGHGVASAMTASICAAALRGTRREGAVQLDQAAAANAALLEHAGLAATDGFVTAFMGNVDLRSGRLDMINCGHPPPLLARHGSVTALDLPPDLPLGLFSDAVYLTRSVDLEPGDRLVIVTDGMLERGAGAFDLAAGVGSTRSLHPREMVRILADDVIETNGHELHDDATILVLDWHGDRGGARRTSAGSDVDRGARLT